MRASPRQVLTLCFLAACGSSGGTAIDSGLSSAPEPASADDGGRKVTISEDPSACQKIVLPSEPDAPEILIVQDRSGSMVGLGDVRNAGKNRWLPSVRALKELSSRLTDTVAFGLMLFPATTPTEGAASHGAGCDPGKLDVAVATGNAEQIAGVLDRSSPDVGATPTAASLVAALAALNTGRAVPKYVLLVTDGQPTCGFGGTRTLPADIEATSAAIDALRNAGIKTYVIGYDTASDAAAAAAMDTFAQHGGTDKHLPVEDEATLLAELVRIAGALVPCEFELNEDVENPSFVRVQIDGVSYEYGKDWILEGRTVRLINTGGACPRLRDAQLHSLAISRECAPVVLL